MNIIRMLICSLFAFCSAASALKLDNGYQKQDSFKFATITINPCHEEGVTPYLMDLPNGSVINFASDGIIGRTIRSACELNDIPNPYGITHSGLIVNADPVEIYDIVSNINFDNSQDWYILEMLNKQKQAVLHEMDQEYHSYLALANKNPLSFLFPFVIESDGSAKEVLHGIYPHVHIHSFATRLKEYNGNIYSRSLKYEITTGTTRDFMNEYLFKAYELPHGIEELIKAIRDENSDERTENVFCSELVACFLKRTGIEIDALQNASNVIPESLSSGAGEFDLLKGIADDDILLKHQFDLSEKRTGIYDKCVQTFLQCFCFTTNEDDA